MGLQRTETNNEMPFKYLEFQLLKGKLSYSFDKYENGSSEKLLKTLPETERHCNRTVSDASSCSFFTITVLFVHFI